MRNSIVEFSAEDVKKAVPLVRYLEDVGIPLRDGNRRAVATWRGGEGANVSIDEEKGLWLDHVAGDGGSVIDAFMRIEGGTFAEAVRALGERYGVDPAKPGSIRPRPAAKRNAVVQKTPEDPGWVRRILGDMETAEQGEPDWVREMSVCLDWLGADPKERRQTADFLTANYNADEFLHITRKCRTANGDESFLAGRMGDNIKTRDEWLADIRAGRQLTGDYIVPNPFSGSADKHGSYITGECIADFPFIALEFDNIPLAVQFAFWRSFLLTSDLAPRLASITHSGNKSLHALLFVGCSTCEAWKREAERLRGFFYSDPEFYIVEKKVVQIVDGERRETVKEERVYPFRIDPAGLTSPRQGTRLPGVRRRRDDLSGRETDVVQELLYLNPFAVRDDAEERWRDVSQWAGPLE